MTPREVLEKCIDAFNSADAEAISNLYAEDTINHQVANESVVGKEAIRHMFAAEFTSAEMVCIPENIFEAGEWAIKNDKFIFQRGYWDKISFHKLHGIPITVTIP